MALTEKLFACPCLLMWKNSQEIGVKQDMHVIVYAFVSGYLNTKPGEKHRPISIFTDMV